MQPASSAPLGFEAQLWAAANALRGSVDAAKYKHVVLGLIFLKYISDAFEEHRKKLLAEPYADPEDPDEYRAENIISNIALGGADNHARDILGRVYAPCCGSRGMFVQSEEFIEASGGRRQNALEKPRGAGP